MYVCICIYVDVVVYPQFYGDNITIAGTVNTN